MLLGDLLTSMMGLEAKTLSSMLASLAEPLTVAKYLMAYLADTVFPAPDSPLTMMDWFLSSLRRQKTNNIRGQNTRNTVVGGAFAKLKVSVTSAIGRLMTKMNCDRIVDSTVDSSIGILYGCQIAETHDWQPRCDTAARRTRLNIRCWTNLQQKSLRTKRKIDKTIIINNNCKNIF